MNRVKKIIIAAFLFAICFSIFQFFTNGKNIIDEFRNVGVGPGGGGPGGGGPGGGGPGGGGPGGGGFEHSGDVRGWRDGVYYRNKKYYYGGGT
jgi:hypothetical protein